MSVKSKTPFMTMCMLAVIIAALMVAQCAKKKTSGCDINHVQIRLGVMKAKLDLSDNQVAQFKKVIHEIHVLTDKDRKQFKSNDEALLKAAKARTELKIRKIESVLDEKQKVKFQEIMAQKKLSDRTILMGERLGLDCDTTEKLNAITQKAPADQEAVDIRRSGDIKRIKAFMVGTRKIHKEIESLLTDDQITEFRKMVAEKMTLVDKLAKEGR
jgi:Spy/CpxP family protein refolding chaperone